MRKILLIGGAVIILIVVSVVVYLFNKPHRDITQEDARHEIEAAEVVKLYQSSEQSANAKFLDHVILIGGEVSEVDSSSITLVSGVYCHMHEEESTAGIKPGDRVDIKGRVVGYDELFGEVRMDFCHFEK